MASIKVRAELFQKSAGRVKEPVGNWLYAVVVCLKGHNSVKKNKKIVEAYFQYKTETVTQIQRERMEREKTMFLQVMKYVFSFCKAQQRIAVLRLWLIALKNIGFFHTHLCWVHDKKKWYLRNSHNSGYVTWMKEGRTTPILRRWFNREHKFMARGEFNEEQIRALLEICKFLEVGSVMSQDDMDSKIVMDLLIGKVYG